VQIKQLIHSKLEITFRGKTQYIAIHPLLVKGGGGYNQFPGGILLYSHPPDKEGGKMAI
jgi:hypothetical protein